MFRCQHNTRRAMSAQEPSKKTKNTNCLAQLTVKIFKSFQVKSHNGKSYHVDLQIGVCSCVVGANGKMCKHQLAVINKFNITDVTNTLCEATRHELYFIATGKVAPDGYFLPLSKNHVSSSRTSSKEITDNTEVQSMNERQPIEVCNSENSECAIIDVESIKMRMKLMFNKLENNLNETPEAMAPALEKILGNFEANSTTNSQLISWLYTSSSKSLPVSCNKKFLKTIKKGRQIPVQPTSTSRRIDGFSGKRKRVGGRPIGPPRNKSIKEHDYSVFGNLPLCRRKRPHSLSECVNRNVSVGCSTEKT